MKKIFTLLLSLIFIGSISAQSRLDYDNDSRWFWGLNVGGTWSTADVKYNTNVGWGIVLGKSFNYQEGRIASFDLRGRFLTGNWEGLNSGLTNVDSLSPYSGLGTDTVKLNHLTRSTSLDLELVLHANRLRARTGWDVYVFGGVGLTFYKSRGDLTDLSGFAYDYNSPFGVIKDDEYETNLVSNDYQLGFMPSLGFGIGHQLGKRASFGLEHKTYFSRVDDFDGYVNSSGTRPNDIFHYTSAYLRFQVRAYNPEYIDNTVNNNNNNITTPVNVPPIVDFIAPANSGTTVNSAQYIIKGKIQHVSSPNKVVFRQNGNYVSNFQFNPSTQMFSVAVTLQPGQNIFELSGTNDFGTDQEQTIINYQELRTPPVVTYTNPSVNPTTVQTASYNVVANITNVSQLNQVTMTINGQPVTGLTFNASTGLASATVNLINGTNTVTTTGTNVYGTDSETTTLIYSPVQTIQPPLVYFVDPNVNPYTVSTPNYTINADVLNVAGQQNIVFKQNGSINNNFSYNTTTHRLISTVVLVPGQNVFEVIGTNQAGTAQATTVILYNRVAPMPPVVTITNPSINPYETANQTFSLSATVLNVTTANQVNVTLNGQAITNFTFNPANGGVNVLLNLINGSNVVTVKGTNNDGTDQKQTVIIYRPVQTVQPPVVQFTVPNMDPFTTNTQNYTASISVLNVTAANQIFVIVNGQNTTNFSFANSIVTLPLNLIDGANTINVSATNTAGTASDAQTIIYQRPNIQVPPTVSFIDPVMNPMSVFNNNYHVKARVRFVNNASQITLKINGVQTTNFTYAVATELMDFTTVLVNGANTIEITATNSAGTDSETTTIIYRELTPVVPPVVTITSPVSNPTVQTANSANVVATVLNVDGPQNIQVSLNGTAITNFNYNTSTKVLTFTLNSLALGNNTVLVTATNSAGQASDNTVIDVKREVIVVPPVVTIVNPGTVNSNTTVQNLAFKATVLNVTAQNQIVVTQNGQVLNSNLWTFNPSTHEVLLNTSLVVGNNSFTVTGTNTGGSDSKSCYVNYTEPVVVCDKPVITFTTPVNGGTSVSVANYIVSANITGVSSPNYIKIWLNGQLLGAGSYNTTTSIFTKTIDLVAGMNAIEIEATNNCGTTKVSTTIQFAPVAPPCVPPVVTRLLPAIQNVTATTTSETIQASVVNAQVSQISVTVNGVSVPFTYDPVTHIVSKEVPLTPGTSSVKVTASTECGVSVVEWIVNLVPCQRPTLTLNTASAANNSTVLVPGMTMEIAVTGITNQNQITVTKNNQAIGFVFNPSSGIISIDAALEVGMNSFAITAVNDCGTAKLAHNVRRNQQATVLPPTIVISNPGNSPYATTQSGMTVQGSFTNITSESQLSVTLNGTPVNVNFNASANQFSFNATFNVGANVINATAVNTAGTATDSRTVVYSQPVTIAPPVITLTNPANCPAQYPRGVQTITGTVTNITDPNQLTILLNNSQMQFTSTVANNVLTFSFNTNVSNLTQNFPLIITATNAAGTDVENCTISILSAANNSGGNNGHGNNTDGNDESNPGQGSGGPNGQQSGGNDDENSNGNGNGNRGTQTKPGTTTKPVTTTKPATTTKPVVKPQPMDPIKPAATDTSKVKVMKVGGGM